MSETRKFFFTQGGIEVGPVTGGELKERAAGGKLTPDDLVWVAGTQQRFRAANIVGLFAAGVSGAPALSMSVAGATAPAVGRGKGPANGPEPTPVTQRVTCPHCTANLRLPADRALTGRVQCPKCKQPFALPAEATATGELPPTRERSVGPPTPSAPTGPALPPPIEDRATTAAKYSPRLRRYAWGVVAAVLPAILAGIGYVVVAPFGNSLSAPVDVATSPSQDQAASEPPDTTFDTPWSDPSAGETFNEIVDEDADFPRRRAVGKLVKGKPEGEVRYFDDNQKLIVVAHFQHGVLQGDRTSYYPSGAKFAVEPFVNGEINGTVTTWFENGQVSSTAEIVNGRPQGKVTVYYRNGNKFCEEDFVNGVSHGERFDYKPDGELFRITVWENDVQVRVRLSKQRTPQEDAAIKAGATAMPTLKACWGGGSAVPASQQSVVTGRPQTSVTPRRECTKCGGTGRYLDICRQCQGTTKINCSWCGGSGQRRGTSTPNNLSGMERCSACFGTGKVGCSACGAGRVSVVCRFCSP